MYPRKVAYYTFFFATVIGILYWYDIFLNSYLQSLNLPLYVYYWVFPIIGILINPVAIFVAFHYLGKKVDLINSFKGAIISVSTGLVIGFYPIAIAFLLIVGSLLHSDMLDTEWYFLQWLPSSIGYLLLAFLAIFGSLAIGYFRSQSSSKKETP